MFSYVTSHCSFHFICQINTGQADGTPGLDLNVAEAWELGYTGKGVTIAIMDDGKHFTECLQKLNKFKDKFKKHQKSLFMFSFLLLPSISYTIKEI